MPSLRGNLKIPPHRISKECQPRATLVFNVVVTSKPVLAEEIQNDIDTWLL